MDVPKTDKAPCTHSLPDKVSAVPEAVLNFNCPLTVAEARVVEPFTKKDPLIVVEASVVVPVTVKKLLIIVPSELLEII